MARPRKQHLSKTQENKRRRRKYPNVFFKQQIVDVFDAINNPKTMVATFVAFFCALRISEVAKLKWIDIDLENRRLKVVDGKNHKDGFIPLSSVCIPILKQWRLMNPEEEYLFPTGTHDQPYYKPDSLYRDYVKALKRAKLHIPTERVEGGNMQHQYKFHTLRHSRCTHLLSNGIPVEKVQRFMRHDDVSTTMTYYWILDTELNNMVENADRQLRPTHNKSQISQPIKESPLEIAKRRLAYGEIRPKEFKKIHEVLQMV